MRIMEMFSTHLKIKDSNGYWIRYTYEVDDKLEKNFTVLYHSDPNDNEEYWAWKFLGICHTDLPELLALRHMSAYLEKFVVNPARRVHRKLSNYQQYTQHQYDIGDVLQIGLLIACDSKQFFPKQFFSNFHQGRPLRNYVCTTMERKIDEMIRQQMGQRRLSDWGLLKFSSLIYLRKSLQGVSQLQLDCYLLAYKCFKEIYATQKPTDSRSLPEPTDQQLQEMANLYNQQVTSGTAERSQMKQWLWDCINALRNYQTLLVVSLDAPSGGDEHSAFLSDTIPDPASGSQSERLMMQEHTPRLMAILSEFLEQIDQKTDNYLLLRYGVEATYRQLAPIFLVHYTTISRHCNPVKQSLLKLVAQWAKQEFNITPDSEMLAQMNAPLEECLIYYYQNSIFHLVFQQVFGKLDRQRRHVLHLSYFWLKDEAAIACELQLDQSHVRQGLETGTQELADAISNWIQQRLTVPPDLLNPLADKIADLVRTLVKNFSAPEF